MGASRRGDTQPLIIKINRVNQIKKKLKDYLISMVKYNALNTTSYKLRNLIELKFRFKTGLDTLVYFTR